MWVTVAAPSTASSSCPAATVTVWGLSQSDAVNVSAAGAAVTPPPPATAAATVTAAVGSLPSSTV